MTDMSPDKLVCVQGGCNYSVDGKCIEGLGPKCSHIVKASEAPTTKLEDSKEVDEGQSEKMRFEVVHRGIAMDTSECEEIMSAAISRFIILAGLAFSGKTTLLASLFQLFQDRDSFANFEFAGSRTLIGFERVCHESRTTSGLAKSNTGRTVNKEEPDYLHLRVQGNGETTDILFTDVSGEVFEKLSNSYEKCKAFEIAIRADHFVLFMDSDLLSEDEKRHQTKVNSIGVLRSLIDSGMLASSVHIDVVFSRWDKLFCKPNRDQHLQFIAEIEAEILRRFSTSHPKLKFYKIASRPDDPKTLGFGYGIDKIFPTWVDKSSMMVDNSPPDKLKVTPRSSREFSKFKWSANAG